MTERVVRVCGLAKSFRFGGQTVDALREVSFDLDRATLVGIVGTSGSGKTTLVNLLGGLDSPSAGEIWVDGIPVHEIPESRLSGFRREKVGFVFQFYNLIPNLSALENVALPLEFGRVPARLREERARQCLTLAGLPRERHRHPPGRLSGGEQQRVAVARALVNEPAIILADEPTGNLDSAMSRTIMKLLFSLVREHGRTVVVVTHDHELARQADRTLVLEDGRLKAG
ncbi:MAG: ABC transporter ATP-binding protein [bacterium]|nr:ABC transporter ATP-binding protein [bacterium]